MEAVEAQTLGGQPVKYIILEDGSDATNAGKNARKLISEDNVDVITDNIAEVRANSVVDANGVERKVDARGFGLRGHEIRDVSVIPKLFADFAAQGESELWNIQISDQVTAPVIRQTIKRGHGNM